MASEEISQPTGVVQVHVIEHRLNSCVLELLKRQRSWDRPWLHNLAPTQEIPFICFHPWICKSLRWKSNSVEYHGCLASVISLLIKEVNFSHTSSFQLFCWWEAKTVHVCVAVACVFKTQRVVNQGAYYYLFRISEIDEWSTLSCEEKAPHIQNRVVFFVRK